jgi:hypothetical protein
MVLRLLGADGNKAITIKNEKKQEFERFSYVLAYGYFSLKVVF